MYLLVIFLIIGLVWYRRRVSGYDLKILNKVKVEPLPSQPDPKSPQKTPKRDFTKIKENPEIKKLQQQTAQYKAVAARQDEKTKTIIQDSAKKIAVERHKATQQVSQIQRQGTNESKNVQNASGREVRAINLRGNIEAAQIKNKGNAEEQKIRNAADAEAGVIRTQAARESADIVRDAKKEATNIANKGVVDSRRIRAEGTQEALNIANKGTQEALNITKQGNTEAAKIRGNEINNNAARYDAVPGYFKNGFSWAGDQFNVSDPNECKRIAQQKRVAVWGHRNSLHPDNRYKNSCYFYHSGPRYGGDNNDAIHMIGCAFGGNPRTGCSAAPSYILQNRQYAILGGRNKKWCADENHRGRITCNRGGIGAWERFTVYNLGNNQVALKGGRNDKWCADEGNRVVCNRGGIGAWERFTVHNLGNNQVALKGGRNGKWCADEGGKIICNRGGIGAWERFKFQPV